MADFIIYHGFCCRGSCRFLKQGQMLISVSGSHHPIGPSSQVPDRLSKLQVSTHKKKASKIRNPHRRGSSVPKTVKEENENERIDRLRSQRTGWCHLQPAGNSF